MTFTSGIVVEWNTPRPVAIENLTEVRRSRPGWSLLRESRELLSPTGVRTHLSSAQWRLLEMFVENSGSVLNRDMLMAAVRGRSSDPFDRYIDVLVGTLRKKFGERAANARIILTVHNEGYLCTLQAAIEP
ncbi:MAG: helix-turn-helix domain-containing protein [Gammaproteobacteria bacterium]|nr:helix-turn-helix domain-containing protein [Gammaproteobacteria bacterium]